MILFIDITIYTLSAGQATSPQFTTQPTDVIAYGEALIPCSSVGTPHPSVTWFKDNVQIVTSNRIVIDNAGALVVTALVPTDAGVYDCVASNSEGSIRSKTARLDIACKCTVTIGFPPILIVDHNTAMVYSILNIYLIYQMLHDNSVNRCAEESKYSYLSFRMNILRAM